MTDKAALAAIRPDMVRELAWKVFCSTSGNSSASAFGDEYVIQHEDDVWALYLPNEDVSKAIYGTLSDARAAAQADYASRIISALDPAFIERIGALERENARLKADRLYIVGCNDGYDAAMDQAAEFCDGAEASWRETADKAYELDHNEAMGWSSTAADKAETCARLASTIRTASVHPLIRGVGLCMLDGKNDEYKAAFTFLNSHQSLELTWGEIDGWEDDCQWRVHKRNGGRNDREWTLLGYGQTVELAISAARTTLQEHAEDGERQGDEG